MSHSKVFQLTNTRHILIFSLVGLVSDVWLFYYAAEAKATESLLMMLWMPSNFMDVLIITLWYRVCVWRALIPKKAH